MVLKSRIALGTVQFGLDYGISNERGQIPEQEIDEILIKSDENGIDTIDTSYAYGSSQIVLGKSLKKVNKTFNIISKLPYIKENPEDVLNLTLKQLEAKSLYGYLLHHFRYYEENPSILGFFEKKKQEGVFRKYGFSLYHPYELELLFKNKVQFDILQIPYSIFDRRFEKYFSVLKEMSVEIHTRSVFLQGLFFKDPSNLSTHFDPIKEKLSSLHKLSLETEIPISSLSLCFSAHNQFVDKIVVGIDNCKNIDDNTRYYTYLDKFKLIKEKVNQFEVTDELILLPFNWK